MTVSGSHSTDFHPSNALAPVPVRLRQRLRFRLLVLATLALLVGTLLVWPFPLAADGLDYDLPGQAGHFYTQANGQGGRGGTGYSITNADGIPFWDAYQRLGGPNALGYPVSRRFVWDGFTVQGMQKVVLQWHPDSRQVAFVNVLDRMHDLGKDGWLQSQRQTPPPVDTAPDAGLSWDTVERRHCRSADECRRRRQQLRRPRPARRLPILEGGRALGPPGRGDAG